MNHGDETVRLARRSLGFVGAAADEIHGFVERQMQSDGGYADRSGVSDLYYTMFSLQCLLATNRQPHLDRFEGYLDSFGNGGTLDLVHLGCLARCKHLCATLRCATAKDCAPHLAAIAANIERFRTPDGGYNVDSGARHATLYGCYLAHAAYQDAGIRMPGPDAVMGFLDALKMSDGADHNAAEGEFAVTTTIAGLLLMRHDYGYPVETSLVDRLLACADTEGGGFRITPAAPVCDLVSTATAVYTLRCLGVDIRGIALPCREFVAGLWHESGGFSGHWLDETVDTEYTFDALLTLGAFADDP